MSRRKGKDDGGLSGDLNGLNLLVYHHITTYFFHTIICHLKC